MSEVAKWYIIKAASGTCEIVSATEATASTEQEQWGPFRTQGEAIAKRVGLIRAGKCQPV